MHNEVRVFNPNFHLDISLVFDYFSDALGHLDISLVFDYFSDALGPFVYISIFKYLI